MTRKHFLNFRNIQGAKDPSSKPPLHSAERELDEDLRANCGTSETSGSRLATLFIKASTIDFVQVRFNLKTRNVEVRTCKDTEDPTTLQKAADFVRAFVFGFEVEDALALIRLDDLFIDSFQIQDVKTLKGDHLARAIGRVAGKGGRTKYTIENVTKTRIVLADDKIHILGSYHNIAIARRALCNLILGSPPSKVYGTLRTVAARASERF